MVPHWTLKPLDGHLSRPFPRRPPPLWCQCSFAATHPRPLPLLWFLLPSSVFVFPIVASVRLLLTAAAIRLPCPVPAFTLLSPPPLIVRVVVWEGVVLCMSLSAIVGPVLVGSCSGCWVFFSFLNYLVFAGIFCILIVWYH